MTLKWEWRQSRGTKCDERTTKTNFLFFFLIISNNLCARAHFAHSSRCWIIDEPPFCSMWALFFYILTFFFSFSIKNAAKRRREVEQIKLKPFRLFVQFLPFFVISRFNPAFCLLAAVLFPMIKFVECLCHIKDYFITLVFFLIFIWIFVHFPSFKRKRKEEMNFPSKDYIHFNNFEWEKIAEKNTHTHNSG